MYSTNSQACMYLGVQQCFGVVYHELTIFCSDSFSCPSKINPSYPLQQRDKTKLLHFIKWFPYKAKRSVGYHKSTAPVLQESGVNDSQFFILFLQSPFLNQQNSQLQPQIPNNKQPQTSSGGYTQHHMTNLHRHPNAINNTLHGPPRPPAHGTQPEDEPATEDGPDNVTGQQSNKGEQQWLW